MFQLSFKNLRIGSLVGFRRGRLYRNNLSEAKELWALKSGVHTILTFFDQSSNFFKKVAETATYLSMI